MLDVVLMGGGKFMNRLNSVRLCIVVTLFVFIAKSWSQGLQADLPRSMGSLGDSITGGALAGFSRQNGWMPWVQANLLLRILSFKIFEDYEKIEDRNLNWSSGLNNGTFVISHARRLIELHGGVESRLKVYNAAVSGAEVQDLIDDQWPRLRQWSQSTLKQSAPDYVTVFIGANDVCAGEVPAMTSLSDYNERLSVLIDDIVSSSSRTKVLISTLPNIEKLREVAKNASANIATLNKCEDVWRAFNLCPTLTLLQDVDDRREVATRVKGYNHIIENIAYTVNAREDQGDRVRVVSGLYNLEFAPDDLSIDCFHPNPVGQNRLSVETWKRSWWGHLHDEVRDAQLKHRVGNGQNCRRANNRSSGLPRCT